MQDAVLKTRCFYEKGNLFDEMKYSEINEVFPPHSQARTLVLFSQLTQGQSFGVTCKPKVMQARIYDELFLHAEEDDEVYEVNFTI